MSSDRYIASIKRLYLAVLLLVFAVVYIYFQEYNRIEDVTRSQILQTLLSFQDVAEQFHPTNSVTEKDLVKFSLEADFTDLAKRLKDSMTKLLVEQPQLAKDPNFIKTEKEFSETSNVPLSNNKILAASIVVIKPNRFSPRSDCEALSIPGSKGHTLKVQEIGSILFDQIFPLTHIRLLNLSYRCNLPIFVRSFLVMQTSASSDWIVALPLKVFSEVSWPNVKFSGLQTVPIKIDQKQFFDSYSDAVKKYVKLDDSYVAIPKISLEAEIFSEAERVTGKFHSPDDLNGAIDDISKNSDSYTTVGGINTTGLFLVQIAPSILTGILFLMFIQLRKLDAYRHTTSEPWLYKDVRGSVELVLAGFTAILPVIAVLGVFGAFADIQSFGFYLPIFPTINHLGFLLPNYLIQPWSMREIFGFPEIPQVDIQGPYVIYIANAYLGLFFVALFIAIAISKKFITILWASHNVD